jgi:hypothetical protein
LFDPRENRRLKKAFALLALMVTPAMASAQGAVVFNNGRGWVRQWTSMLDPMLINFPFGGGYVQLVTALQGTVLANPLGGYGAWGF